MLFSWRLDILIAVNKNIPCFAAEYLFDLEILWVGVKILFHYILLRVCYRPPSSAVADSDVKFNNCINGVTTRFPNHGHVLSGDFNLPDIDWPSLQLAPGCPNSVQ